MSLIEKKHPLFIEIAQVVQEARKLAYRSNNAILLGMNWHIGKLIVEEEQGGKHKAEYGKAVLKNLSILLTQEFGKGFDERNLNNMRAFYSAFPIWNAVRTELSWTHYRIISRVESIENRTQYMLHCIESNWDTRTLQRNIKTFFNRTLLY